MWSVTTPPEPRVAAHVCASQSGHKREMQGTAPGTAIVCAFGGWAVKCPAGSRPLARIGELRLPMSARQSGDTSKLGRLTWSSVCELHASARCRLKPAASSSGGILVCELQTSAPRRTEFVASEEDTTA